MSESTIFKGKLLCLACAFGRSPVDDHDVGDLLQLDVESQRVGFHVV